MYYKHVIVVLVVVCAVNCEKFKVIREWNYLNFTWPNEELYRNAVSQGLYIPEHNIIAGIKQFGDYYVTLPRMKNGVPATLARFPAGTVKDTAPALMPFPSWEMNALGDCNALQNVQNIEIDAKGQIWIIDSGRTETLSSSPTIRCPPKLIIFDINKNMTTTAYTFPDSVANFNFNFLYDLVVDNTDGGYAYITDNSAKDPGIIVFSVKDHHSWKIRHSQSMKGNPSESTFRVGPVIVQALVNIASIALGPRVRVSNGKVVVNEDREVYYCPLSSLHLYSMNSSVLKNEMNGMNNGEYQGDVIDLGEKTSQGVGMVMDNVGMLYYTLLTTNSIARWNTRMPFQNSAQVIARDSTYLEWPSSFTFDQEGNLTVLVNRLNRFIYDKLHLNEPNFRLITSKVGGKSYLFDQTYDYNTDNNKAITTTPPSQISTVSSDLPAPEIYRPGSDQDPYLAPRPMPKQSTTVPVSEPTPTAEPIPPQPNDLMNLDETEHDNMDHDHMGHDHMGHDHMDHDHMSHDDMMMNQKMNATTPTAPAAAPASRSTQLVSTFMGVLVTSMLFVV